MFLQLEVFDSNKRFQGYAEMMMDWTKKTWQIMDDDWFVWNRIGFSKGGTFEFKSWGVIWLWDQARNTVIFWDAPKNNFDFSNYSGQARIFDPRDSALKEGKINWKIDMTVKTSSTAAAAPGLTPLRIQLLTLLRKVLPCSYMDKNYKLIAPGLTKQGGGYTTCGSLPGFVTSELGGKPLGKGWETYMQKYSLNGTNAVRIKGLKYGAWVDGEIGKRPKPGDIYALLNHHKTDRVNDGISHVGVIMDSSGSVWKTADMGQGGGYDGKIDVERPYKADTGELWGESNQGGGYRTIAGWVDIDKYFAKK